MDILYFLDNKLIFVGCYDIIKYWNLKMILLNYVIYFYGIKGVFCLNIF